MKRLCANLLWTKLPPRDGEAESTMLDVLDGQLVVGVERDAFTDVGKGRAKLAQDIATSVRTPRDSQMHVAICYMAGLVPGGVGEQLG